MNQNTNTLQIIEGIYDIQPLAEPAHSLLEKTLFLSLLALFVSLTVYLIWNFFYSNKAIARREIKELHNKYKNNKINNHDAIYQLCFITKRGLKLKKLNKDSSLPDKLASNNKQWQYFIKNISTLRYQDSKDENADLNKLFSDSLFWLKVWP